MKNPAILLILCLFLFACNKEKKKPYSYWTINGEEFKTNEVTITRGKAIIDFQSINLSNGFYMRFDAGTFAMYDSILIDSIVTAYSAWFDIIYNDTGYVTQFGPATFLHISDVKGKTQFSMNETWLYNSYRPFEDSVRASGTFVVPN